MKISRFVNDLESAPLHSSELAGSDAPAPQSFSERQQIEQHRELIQGYQKSLTGMARIERGRVRSSPRPGAKTLKPPADRQHFNASGGPAFKEPPARTYNPYS